MIATLAAIGAAGILLPHVLRLERVPPVTAIVLWGSALALRALTGVLGVILLVFFLPRTGAFGAVTHWCLNVGLLDVEGHGIADLSLVGPGLALGLSLLVACHRTARSARRARRLVERETLGGGPRESVIVGGPDVLFAVAGILRPRIVVSAGALTCLDDDELDAALDHERGHIVRRHRLIMVVAIGCAALGRALPGTARALRALAFHLERDADRWALRQRTDRLALASVICKAATTDRRTPPALAGLAGTGVRERLSQLLLEHPSDQRRAVATALNALATGMVACTLLFAVAVPAAAVAGVGGDAHRTHHTHHCHHR